MTVTNIATGQDGRLGSIQSAIAVASRRTGINFTYLLGQAQVESGLRSDARAPTSSAAGLYQFVEQSWLAVVRRHGADHGLGWAARSIQPGAGGRLTVGDPDTRRAILDLRNDPRAAALMAAEHAADNKLAIEGTLGRAATGTDLYMAHFLGLGGARSFLTQLASNPERIGAAMFPAAARANRGIFYDQGGQPRTLAQIYDRLAARLDRGAAIAANGLNPPPADAGDAGRALAALMTPLDDSGGADAVADATVIAGPGERSALGALEWARTTLGQLGGGQRPAADSVLRPTPATARLAYLMLASLGGSAR